MCSGFVSAGSEISWWRTEFRAGERERLEQAFAREQISQGVVGHQLEAAMAEALSVRHAVLATSGSTALQLACMALGIGPGDEVICPDRTFIATAHGAQALGAAIRLVDCEIDNPNVDVGRIEAQITPRTRAIMPVHLNGRACDMDAILAIARRHSIAVIEDAAQALFSRDRQGRMLGTLGDLGCFSFGMTKLMSTGQGGMVVTNDDALVEKLRLAKNHGVLDLATHEYLAMGLNFKFPDLLSAIGLAQLERRAEKVENVVRIHRLYEEGLANSGLLRIVPVDIEAGEVPLWVEVVSDQRERIMSRLSELGIQTRKFLPCLHSAGHLSDGSAFPNSRRFGDTGFVLPCGPDQPLDRVERVITALRTAF